MSEKLARQLFAESRQLRADLASSGWSRDTDVPLVDNKSPEDLFNSKERPLVVGLFGGTGVGKSSLLNRLAGADIARTGVVRPTSMEITAYLHNKVQLEALPEHFSAARLSENRHSNDQLAGVMWVDMPDFDSAETENRDQVLQWLPHIDLLIYVVTPERYKDAEGWRMMLENGYRHAWLFVMNKWDMADPLQFKDFTKLLVQAGFESPQVFKTVCKKPDDASIQESKLHPDDQYAAMVQVIASLANHNIIQHLHDRGWLRRLTAAQGNIKKETEQLVVSSKLGVHESFDTRFTEFSNAAAAHLDSPFKTHAALFADDKTNPIVNVVKSIGGSNGKTEVANRIAARNEPDALWDDWLTIRLQDTIRQFELAQVEHGVPEAVLSSAHEINADDVSGVIKTQLKLSVEDAIKNPGTWWSRLLSSLASVLQILLPVAALGWIAYRVVMGFVAGAEDRTAYVGLDFFVNGLLLAGLGWLIPWVVKKVFVPSLPDTVYRSMHTALQSTLKDIKQQMQTALNKTAEKQEALQAAAVDLDQRIDKFVANAGELPDPALSRVLLTARESS